jgi:cytochrome c peroxidase
MHVGQFSTLDAVVRHYATSPQAAIGHSELAQPGEKHAQQQTIELCADDIKDLAAFLGALTGPVHQPR